MQKKLLNSFLATVMTMVLTIAGILGGVSFYVGEEVACADAATTVTGLSAQQIAQNMGVGWNLGNSLDVPGSETDWGNPATTQAMLQAVKDKGFGAVRIPITWYPYLSSDGNYTVDSTRMARVKEVVDYAYDLGLYVIINVHHENWININNSTGTISASEYAAMSTELKAVWVTILNA